MRARWLLAAALAGAGVATTALGDVAQLTQPVIDALTTIDALPTTEQLDSAHGGSRDAARANLTAIALGQGVGIDAGVRIRAVRVLAQYCAPAPCDPANEAHVALATIATTPRFRDARRGSDVLVLRAALEALGELRVPADLAIIVPALEHPTRDIRAAAARALRDLGDPAAIPALRGRYQQEQVPQVRLAISDALRALGQPL